MNVSDLIHDLSEKGIELSFSKGKIKYKGPEENITPEVLELLKRNKSALLKYLWPKELGGLMPINPIGSKTPIFFVHGDKGNYILSEHLGPDQPFYGFFHPGSDGEGIPYTSVKAMARAYLRDLKTIQPCGKYYLMGYSFGGLLAFEMACLLQQSGEEVPFLVLIDSVSPKSKEAQNPGASLFGKVRRNILSPLRRKVKREFHLLICNLYLFFKKKIPAERRTFYLWIKYLKMTNKYSPGKFNGNMLLFKTTGNPSIYPYLGWEGFTDSIKLVEIEGKHLDVFIGEERINILQKVVSDYLKKLESEDV